MTPGREPDEFEGIDISGPWGGIRIGSGGVRVGNWSSEPWDDDAEVRAIRRRVRRRLDFFKNVAFFVLITGGLALIDWLWGEDWWVQWVAAIWGAFLGLQFFGTFLAPVFWGREAEERMVRRELERRRGRARVIEPEDAPEE